jgi:hypothetical protein
MASLLWYRPFCQVRSSKLRKRSGSFLDLEPRFGEKTHGVVRVLSH